MGSCQQSKLQKELVKVFTLRSQPWLWSLWEWHPLKAQLHLAVKLVVFGVHFSTLVSENCSSILSSWMVPPESSSQFSTQTAHRDLSHFCMNHEMNSQFFFREWRDFDPPGSNNQKSGSCGLWQSCIFAIISIITGSWNYFKLLSDEDTLWPCPRPFPSVAEQGLAMRDQGIIHGVKRCLQSICNVLVTLGG